MDTGRSLVFTATSLKPVHPFLSSTHRNTTIASSQHQDAWYTLLFDGRQSQPEHSRGAPRRSSAEAKRLLDERLQSYNADDSNSLLARLWDRAAAQCPTQQSAQHSGGQASDRPDPAGSAGRTRLS
ncbi:hypothetical protein VPNG_02089 [Cytospora leucostoma]|uniref:Uncharacterized protein n=1 Tax=Cytospora leucostoma TaxID=1230097 RepID=A0A423XHQ6_9PEZI|nr:hypothetical protein VPNG_02089 [Cytospora leucostoma]